MNIHTCTDIGLGLKIRKIIPTNTQVKNSQPTAIKGQISSIEL